MSNPETKNKHLTLQDRIEIQECLCKGMSFKDIAKRIGKSATTISREVKQRFQLLNSGFTKKDEPCPTLLKAPFVCNACELKSRSSCQFRRQIYGAKKAQADYELLLRDARSGIPLNKEIFYKTEGFISDAVRKGQHIYHVVSSNVLPVSTATVYRHIKKGYYTISEIDLPRAVKFKPRRSKQVDYVPRCIRKGREYNDYLTYIEDTSPAAIVELDTVIGRIGGKVIMTIHFVESNFMVGLLLDNKTAVEAATKISALKAELKENGFSFGEIVPVILTDNGGEFSNVFAFENDADGEQETKLFFCEPNASYEKPHIEKNHTLFRDIVPKGTSFDDFTQDTVDLIFSHVNSVKRKKFRGKSAYELFVFYYSEEVAEVFGIKSIPPEKVVQSPLLLKKSFSK